MKWGESEEEVKEASRGQPIQCVRGSDKHEFIARIFEAILEFEARG